MKQLSVALLSVCWMTGDVSFPPDCFTHAYSAASEAILRYAHMGVMLP